MTQLHEGDEARCAATLARLQSPDGDAAAIMSELYDVLAPRLYGIAVRLCGCPDLAQTVCAQVFCHLRRHHADFDPAHGTVTQWATQLTHRFALLATGDQQATQQRTVDLLDSLSAVRGLSNDQRHDLADAYFGGLTYREIARQRGVAPDQISTTLRASLRRVRTATSSDDS